MLNYLTRWFYKNDYEEKNEINILKIYEIKFPNNIVIEAKGISPRNVFESYIYKQNLKGNNINYTYYDVSYNIQRI